MLSLIQSYRKLRIKHYLFQYIKNNIFNMTVVFIRHSDDNGSDPSHHHDPKVTRRGKKKAENAAYELIRMYGEPSVIFCSPFRRTLETSKRMKKMCNLPPEIYIDNNLSRYFSKKEKKNPDISSKTRKYDVPIYESWNDFEERINKHIQMLIHSGYKKSEDVVWVVSHALVYKHVARVYGVDIPIIIPFLEHFVVHEYSIELPKRVQRRRRREESRRKEEYFKSKRNKKRAKKYM